MYDEPWLIQLLDSCPGNKPKFSNFVTSLPGYPGNDVPHSVLSGQLGHAQPSKLTVTGSEIKFVKQLGLVQISKLKDVIKLQFRGSTALGAAARRTLSLKWQWGQN